MQISTKNTLKSYCSQALQWLLLIGILAYGIYRGGEANGYYWQWYRIPRYFGYIEDGSLIFGPLVSGTIISLKIILISALLTTLIAVIIAIMRLSSSAVASWLARCFLEIIRNTPLLIQIFFFYFVIAPHLGIDRFWSAVITLSLFEAAYGSEIIRAGICSLPKGQWEAAATVGMSIPATYRHVILPQSLRVILPPLTGQAVSLIKDSALVSTIAVYELTMQGQAIIAETFLTFEIWFTVAGIYLCLTIGCSALARLFENRLKRGSV